MIVTVTPTIQSGVVVRWYRDIYDAHNYLEFMSASREKVSLRNTEILSPPDLADLISQVDVAMQAMADLRAGKDVESLATHRRPFLGKGELVPL